MELLIVGNFGVYQMRRRGGDSSMVDGEANPFGIIDNAVQPVINIIGQRLSQGIIEHWDVVGGRIEHSMLHKDVMAIVAKFIEEVGEWVGLQIRDSIKPVFIDIKVVVKNGQISKLESPVQTTWGRLSHPAASVYGRMLM